MGELQLYVTKNYKTTSCITCGVDIVLVDEFYDKRLKNGKLYYCPNGHSQYFLAGRGEEETEEQRLRKVIDKERAWRAQQERETERQRLLRRAAERREAAQKGLVTRLKNRAAAGLCSCCNRSFVNLKRHMEIKHPEQIKAAGRDV